MVSAFGIAEDKVQAGRSQMFTLLTADEGLVFEGISRTWGTSVPVPTLKCKVTLTLWILTRLAVFLGKWTNLKWITKSNWDIQYKLT